MNQKAGIWIDHTKAVLAFIDGEKEHVVTLESNIKRHLLSPLDPKDRNPNGRRNVTPDDIRQREFKEHMNVFYKKIVSTIGDPAAIIIFGPGEAKKELEKYINKTKLKKSDLSVMPAEKLSDRKIMAKVRDYFHDKDRRNNDKVFTSRRLPKLNVSRRKSDLSVLPA